MEHFGPKRKLGKLKPKVRRQPNNQVDDVFNQLDSSRGIPSHSKFQPRTMLGYWIHGRALLFPFQLGQ